MMRLRIFLSVLVLAFPMYTFAQSTLQGMVADSATGEKLTGVNVFLLGTSLGAATDLEGRYRIPGIPAGQYTVRVSYVGYGATEVVVNLPANQIVELNVLLQPGVVLGEEVVITAQMRGQMAAINQQLTSNTIVNVVSEERIQELPDANAAAAIGRLSGVSLLRSGGEASRVVLRGLSDKFSVVTIDGVRMSPTDANNRGIDLSTIAQGSLAGIELYKASTPDKDADAIAGSVNLVTRKAPAERLLRIEPRGSYNNLEQSANQYNLTGRYGERFLGGLFGVQVSGNLERSIRSNESTDQNYDLEGLGADDYEITQLQVTYTDEIRNRAGGSLLLDFDTPDNGSIRLNTVFNQTSRDYITSFRTYNQGTGVAYDYRDRETEISTFNTYLHGDNYFYGFEANWNLAFSQSKRDDPFDFHLNMTEASTDTSGMDNVPAEYAKGPTEQWIQYARNNFLASYINQANDRAQTNYDKERSASLDLKSNYTISDFISGEVKFGGKYRDKSRFAVFHELRSNYYLYAWPEWTEADDGSIVRKDLSGTRFENLQLTQGGLVRFTNFLDSNPLKRDIYGRYALYPLINRDALKLWRQLNIKGFLDQGGTDPEYKRNFEVEGDYYDVTERILAGYVMNTLNFGRTLTFIAGVRVESDDNDYGSKFTPQPLSGFPFPQGVLRDTIVSHKENVVLPNMQTIIRPLEFMNIRIAAYKALARPDFNQRLLKFIARSASGNVLDVGNPDLRNAQAWNYEFQAQFFGNTVGLFSVSAFYKDVKDMYHFINGLRLTGPEPLDSLGIRWPYPFPTDPPVEYLLTFPYNSSKPTRIWGFEVEHQTDFKWLPGLLKNIVLNYNFTIVRSETWIPTSKVVIDSVIRPPFPFPVPVIKYLTEERKQKLEDQPEFFGNVSLGYDIGDFSFRISVFHQGSYNSIFSSTQRSDGVQDSYTRWDIAVKQKFLDNISFILNINNITNTQEGNTIVNRFHPEWNLPNTNNQYEMTVDFGVRIEL